MSNFSKPRIVFTGKTQPGIERHDAGGKDEWNDGVVVSFQNKVQVDTHTQIYGLEKNLGPMNMKLGDETHGKKALILEDNLSTHYTEKPIE